MHTVDWVVLIGTLVAGVLYGVWKSRGIRSVRGFLLADRTMRWPAIALSIMATQASAITFLSTPGQAYADGMRFVQYYLGLPIAMVVLCIVAVPLYHRANVFTAYEFLERRLGVHTRLLTAGLFLIQRGLAAGLTIYAPAIILSVLLGWDMRVTVLVIGITVTLYTAFGGTQTVQWTHLQQMLIIFAGLVGALLAIILHLPDDVSFLDAARVAGKLGRLNAIVLRFDWTDRYTLWSGLIGGMFLALSYFGTDQSQVQRYLTGRSVTQSRLGLLFNGLVKVPMQFFILFLGAMVFAFYQFVPPPVFFNPVEIQKLRNGPYAAEFRQLETRFDTVWKMHSHRARALVAAFRAGDPQRIVSATHALRASFQRVQAVRAEILRLMERNNPRADTNDVNYVFLTFVIHYLPPGVVGLILAMVLAAAMSSTASELNALASTTVVDVYRRLVHSANTDVHLVWVSRIATIAWGALAITFALYARHLGSLVEAINILGSLFYGTILGIFLVAFRMPRVGGGATIVAAILAEAVVFYFYLFTDISWLWYNAIGCLVVVLVAPLLRMLKRK